MKRWGIVLVGLLLTSACARGPEPEAPIPDRPRLPPIPAVDGALGLVVRYPPAGGAVTARDSTFVFGETGTGRATLRINGTPVDVAPNGAFLAFLPVPPDGVYRFEAARDGERDTATVRVRVPAPPAALPAGRAAFAPGSAYPRGAWTVEPGERVEVGFRGTPGGRAALILPDGRRVPLAESAAASGDELAAFRAGAGEAPRRPTVSTYRGLFTATPILAADTSVPRPTLALPARTSADAPAPGPATLELVVGGDTARTPLPLNLALLERPRAGTAHDPTEASTLSGPEVIGRPGPGLTYHWIWPNGTEFTVTGERSGEYRVRLADDLDAWVGADEMRLQPEGAPPVSARVGTVRLTPGERFVDVRFSLSGDRVPFRIEEGERSLTVSLYGAASNTDRMPYGRTDDFVELMEWDQVEGGVYVLRLEFSRMPWGYDAAWADNGDLVLRVRRPPPIDPERPLRGRRIAVDPGHPPGGAIGPTGYTEAEANLAISLRLRDLLERAGAEVVMTHTDLEPMSLQARMRMAQEADADLLVSVHNNAFPDGVNPWTNSGTSVYYYHPPSLPLARELQLELLRELGLRDLGVFRGNLALARPTWMPSVLTETMFLMVPEQEAALRDPGVQERIARAHLRAIEDFLRLRAGR